MARGMQGPLLTSDARSGQPAGVWRPLVGQLLWHVALIATGSAKVGTHCSGTFWNLLLATDWARWDRSLAQHRSLSI